MSTNPRFPKNIKRGEHGAHIYWRALWAMEDDAICSMFSEKVLKGLAGAYQEGMVDENNKGRFSRSGARYWAGEVINLTPLSMMSDMAIAHIATVIDKAMFPEDYNE